MKTHIKFNPSKAFLLFSSDIGLYEGKYSEFSYDVNLSFRAILKSASFFYEMAFRVHVGTPKFRILDPNILSSMDHDKKLTLWLTNYEMDRTQIADDRFECETITRNVNIGA